MKKRHVVATLMSDGVTPFEYGVTAEVFGGDRSYLGVDWYQFKLCLASSPLTTCSGTTMTSQYGLADVATADTVIVTPTIDRQFPTAVLDAVVAAHKRGARIVSMCTGTFLLAEAGLLDGRRVTTHWKLSAELAARYPSIHVDSDVLYVDDGDILTSAGTAASIDLSLHIVRLDYGAEIANAVARSMVVPPHRDGGQAQYVDHPIDSRDGSELFSETLAWAEANIADPITIDDLARRSAMSPRTFARRFSETNGTTPHQWLTHQRVQLAQRLLESTNHSIEYIATAAGLGSATNMRLHFQRIVKTTPTQYRRTFCCLKSAG